MSRPNTINAVGKAHRATWDEFELDGKTPVWIVPAERMKMRTEHVVPLSKQAVDVLRELKALSGDSRYILLGLNPD